MGHQLREDAVKDLRIDGDRRQELVSPLFEMLRDDNFRRLCESFVGRTAVRPKENRAKRGTSHSENRSGVVGSSGIDGDRRQKPVSPLFEMLRDDNSRRSCSSFVGANGCSPLQKEIDTLFYNTAARSR